MAIYWSPTATSAFERLDDRIAASAGETAAQRWRQRVSDRIELVALLPFASRMVPEFAASTYREVFEDDYRIH